ncbi:MAG: chromate efflux transporter [Candidatus Riflebacteria bacterium]|nr:chromate efflux transporter [Candidatus Riflebacteria bacterium]
MADLEEDVVTRKELLGTFFLIGATSYGGPAIVARIHQVIVHGKRWLTEEEFEESVAFCQILPGPVAVQLATHIGWRLHGGLGALLVSVSYTLPAFGLMLALSAATFRFGHLPLVDAILKGLGAAVSGIVADATLSMARSSLKDWRGALIALGAAAAFFTRQDALVVLLGAAIAGACLTLHLFRPVAEPPAVRPGRPCPPGGTGAFSIFVLAALFLALVAAGALRDPGYPALGLAMMKVNLLAFGGGYTAIALMYQQVVTHHAWLTAKEFITGMALSQITPGPVIVNATFIGYKLGGWLGAIYSTFCVFWPSGLLLVLLAPHFARIRSSPILKACVRGLLAAFIAMLVFVLWQMASASIHGPSTAALAVGAFVALRVDVHPIWIILATVVLAAGGGL